jgi:hypothetical protein
MQGFFHAFEHRLFKRSAQPQKAHQYAASRASWMSWTAPQLASAAQTAFAASSFGMEEASLRERSAGRPETRGSFLAALQGAKERIAAFLGFFGSPGRRQVRRRLLPSWHRPTDAEGGKHALHQKRSGNWGFLSEPRPPAWT